MPRVLVRGQQAHAAGSRRRVSAQGRRQGGRARGVRPRAHGSGRPVLRGPAAHRRRAPARPRRPRPPRAAGGRRPGERRPPLHRQPAARAGDLVADGAGQRPHDAGGPGHRRGIRGAQGQRPVRRAGREAPADARLASGRADRRPDRDGAARRVRRRRRGARLLAGTLAQGRGRRGQGEGQRRASAHQGDRAPQGRRPALARDPVRHRERRARHHHGDRGAADARPGQRAAGALPRQRRPRVGPAHVRDPAAVGGWLAARRGEDAGGWRAGRLGELGPQRQGRLPRVQRRRPGPPRRRAEGEGDPDGRARRPHARGAGDAG